MAKKALCIGINDYPGTDGDLAGCINDAHDWKAALAARGFVVSQLLDEAAHKEAISDSLGELIDDARAGDTLVITYSGHGTWAPDMSGDDIDQRDEAWCPHDLTTAGALLDDELRLLLNRRAAGVRILIISDSCHSGSVNRGDESDVDADMPRARFMPPSVWLPAPATLPANARNAPVTAGIKRLGSDLLLAGCRDDEFSWDTRFGGRPNGAFTYYALKTLKSLPSGASYDKWFSAIRDYLPSTRLPQEPQMAGSRTARRMKIFE